MQTGTVSVRLGGDLNNSVPKQDVTPAEVVMLRAIHGEESVLFIEATGTDKRSHSEEWDRLFQRYGEAKDKKDEPLFLKLWPNKHAANFPIAFKDIGIDVLDLPAPKRRKRAEKAEVEPAAAGDGAED